MDTGLLCSWMLLGFALAALWPLNVPLLALSYKVNHGHQPVPFETGEFWLRSAGAALALSVMILAPVGLYYLFVRLFEFTAWADLAGFAAFAWLLAYVPLAVLTLYKFYAFDEPVPAFMVFLIYTFLPGLIFLVLNLFLALRERLARLVIG